MNLKAIIIEDEEDCQLALEALLLHYCQGVEVVAITDRISEAVKLISLHQPDLVFLDIELPIEDGFSLFNYIPDPNFKVVFTTAYDQYAAKAFRLSALDYLLKPIDLEELKVALTNATKQKVFHETQKKLAILKENLNGIQQRLVLPTQEGFSFVELKDILYCEALGNYTQFYFFEEEKLLVSKTLKIFSDMLEEFSFFRISRSHLININHIKKYGRQKCPTITMQDGTTLSVSVKRRDDFFKKITSML